MDIFTQEEWHGMARHGQYMRDPHTSDIEINTRPGGDALERIATREPLLSSKLPAPAIYFDSFGSHLKLVDSSGADVDFTHSGANFSACVCFRWDGKTAYPASRWPWIFGTWNASAADATGWVIRASVVSDTRVISVYFKRDSSNFTTVNTTTELEEGAWYWVQLDVTSTLVTVTVYKDGSLSSQESVDSGAIVRDTFSGTYPLFLGGVPENTEYGFFRGSIAYAATAALAASMPSQWVGIQCRDGQSPALTSSFLPCYADKTAFPGKVGSADDYSWVFNPRPGLKSAACTTAGGYDFNASGVVCKPGEQLLVDLSNEGLFRNRTVFFFYGDFPSRTRLLTAGDSTFTIALKNNMLWCYYTPVDPTTHSSDEIFLQKHQTYSTVVTTTSTAWFALEIIPTTEATSRNINFYEWTSATWNNINNPISAAGATSKGLLAPAAPTWALNKGLNGESSLYDFRVLSGDDDWVENVNPTSDALVISTAAVAWLNQATGGSWPRDENITTFTLAEASDYTAKTIAFSDRIDAYPRYRSSHLTHQVKWFGCEYLDNSFFGEVHDCYDAESGSVHGITDAYFFEDSTPKVACAATSKGRRVVANVGSHKYIVGPGPLSFVGQRSYAVGIPEMYVFGTATGGSDNAATKDDEGELDYATTYKFKLTVYNPVTGYESAFHGPYHFTTDANPASSSGCGYNVTMRFETLVDLSGHQCRFYRFAAGTGTYHLEGWSRISFWNDLDVDAYSIATFRFGMDDTDLVLQPELEEDGQPPRDHTFSFLWNGRAWIIDAINPSRMRFSKVDEYGNYPLSNLLLTDEGVGGKILGAIEGFGGMLLLKERSIWIVPQPGEDGGYYAQALIPDVGCVSGTGAVFANGMLWWASPGGVYSFNGQEPVNHSERLDGIDRLVWDHAPRECAAWYDHDNFKIVFMCQGSGISFDVRTGAAAKLGLPETCYADMSSSAYSGPIFGSHGMVYKEGSTSRNQVVDTDGNLSGYNTDAFGTSLTIAGNGYQNNSWFSGNTGDATVFDINSTNAGKLTITHDASTTNWYDAAITTPRLYRHVKGDFVITCKAEFSADPAANSEVGIGVEDLASPASDHIKFYQLDFGAGFAMQVTNTAGGSSDADDSVGAASLNLYPYYRVTRAGDVFTFEYSTDGSNWSTLATKTRTDIGDTVRIGPYVRAAGTGFTGLFSEWSDSTDAASRTIGPIAVGSLTDINWSRHDGVNSGTERVGAVYATANMVNFGYLEPLSLVGRAFTQLDSSSGDAWSTVIHCTEFADTGVFYFKSRQADLTNFYLDRYPWYYKSQRIFFARKSDPKIIQRFDFVTDEETGGGSADVQLYSQIYSESSALSVSATAVLSPETLHTLAGRMRGNYGYYTFTSDTPEDISRIKDLRFHYHQLRTRGRRA